MVLMTRQSHLLPRISSAGRFRMSRQVSAASPTSARKRTTSAIRFLSLCMLAHCVLPDTTGPTGPSFARFPVLAQDETAGNARAGYILRDARGTGPAWRGGWAPGAGAGAEEGGQPDGGSGTVPDADWRLGGRRDLRPDVRVAKSLHRRELGGAAGRRPRGR